MAQLGRTCPATAHAVRTDEGARVWDAVRRSGAWSGGGMTPLRLDRSAIRARLDDLPGWLIEALLDAFEPAALRARNVADKRRKKAAPTGERAAAKEDPDD